MGSCSVKRKSTKCLIVSPSSQPSKTPETVLIDLNPTKKNIYRPNQHKKQVSEVNFFGYSNSLSSLKGTKKPKPKSSTDIKLIKASLLKHFIFSSLSESQINLLINEMNLFYINSAETIFEQDSKGSEYFIVSTGRLEVIINKVKKGLLNEGDSFGELALLHDTLRTATIKTVTNAALWVLNRETFKRVLRELNIQQYNENKAFIESVPMFSNLSEVHKESLINCLTVFLYLPGEKIVNEGDPGDLFFIIKHGSVTCISNGKSVRRMNKGEFFGEQALIYNCTRTASVIANENVSCLALNREDLKTSLGESLELIIYKNSCRIAIDKNEYLQKLRKNQAENIIKHLSILNFEPGQQIVEPESQEAAGVFIVLIGVVNQGSLKFRVFDVIQIESIISGTQEDNIKTLVADSKVTLAYISKELFFKAIGGNFSDVTTNNEILSALKKIQIFKSLDNTKLEILAGLMKTQEFKDEEIIVEENTTGNSFYLIQSGKVEIVKGSQVIRTHTKLDYFGERSLLFDYNRSATAIAKKQVKCWVLYKDDFLSILTESMKTQLMTRIDLQDDSIQLADLAVVKTIGNGMFGNVFLTVHKTKNKLFALKTVDRRKIAAYEVEDNLVLERKVLLQLDHIFIMKLVKTFKDSRRLYFLLEYIEGLDLFDVIRELGLLKESDSQFYVACIFIIFEHLHERNIIYRDLKPENMVVDKEGYIRLIDFGTAKFVQGRTYTIVGTPHYMAPEVITSHGYTLTADYWTVGIILFELLVGYVPFGEDESDPYAIYEQVQKHKLSFPNWLDNRNKVKEFITQLLSVNPANRFSGKIEMVKGHMWFAGFNWDKVLCKEYRSPYIPKIQSLKSVIENTLNNPKSLDEVISKIETKEELPKRKRRTNPPGGWDVEF